MNRSKNLGTKWESAIVAYLRGRGFVHAERRALSGARDRGDLTGIPGVVVEAKNVSRLDLSGWLDETEAERGHANADVGAVWIKRRGTTDPGRSYVVLSGEDFTWLLQAAGYGPEELRR